MKYLIILSLLFIAASMQNDTGKELKPKFSHPEIIRYDHNTFYINGEETFIYSGSLHYYRCDPGQWSEILHKIKAAGFNTVDTYVPWNFHEQEMGKLDLTMLKDFLNLCQQMDFYIIIRPGPYICAEWDIGGYPRWLAGKGIGFRTASAQNIYWSKYWFDEVLPVIRKYLITNGGKVILLQIENEYDYYDLPESQKVEYIHSLYQSVSDNDIDVPVFTCWTKEVRDNTDSVSAQIMDAVNGYPGWNIEGVYSRIKSLIDEEPYAPPIFTELQGGWFSAVDDKTVRQLDRLSADQINALTKYVIAQGIKGLNYYVLFGGTNFEYWAGKEKTTSYDYTAPISECGGLWDKYYAVKLIGDFLKYSHPYLGNSHEISEGAVSDNQDIETILLSDNNVGFLFVRNKTGKLQNADIQINMPGKNLSSITVSIDSLNVYFLPVDFPIGGGGILQNTNVELSAVTEYNNKPFLIAYGSPGKKAVMNMDSKVFSETILSHDKLYFWNGIYVLLTPGNRAERSIQFDTNKGSAVLLSDSYLTLPDAQNGNAIGLQTRPGQNLFSLLATGDVQKILLDGESINYTKSPSTDVINFTLNTPDYSVPEVKYGKIRVKDDDEAEKKSDVKTLLYSNGIYPTLDSLGEFQNGYFVYEGKFEIESNKILKASYYSDDWHSIYIDGKLVKGLTGNTFYDYSEMNLSKGIHDIKILTEKKGRPNFGFMDEDKGIKSLNLLASEQIRTLKKWKFAVQLNENPGPNPTAANSGYNDSDWVDIDVSKNLHEVQNNKQLGSWYRKIINLTNKEAGVNPRLIFERINSGGVVFVNGKQVYSHKYNYWSGPFNVLLKGAVKPGSNSLAVYIENEKGRGGIEGPIKFEYGVEEPLKLDQFTCQASLNGELSGWHKPDLNDSDWSSVQIPGDSQPHFGIKWFRTWFEVKQIKNWIAPMNIHVESTGNLKIWLNGKLLGLYFPDGPQNDFYIPEGWLKERNSLVFAMRPGSKGNVVPELKDFSIGYYTDYIVQKHKLTIEQ